MIRNKLRLIFHRKDAKYAKILKKKKSTLYSYLKLSPVIIAGLFIFISFSLRSLRLCGNFYNPHSEI